MRDALSILDLCTAGGTEITEETVAASCGMAGNEYLIRLAEDILHNDIESGLLLLDELHRSSVDTVRLIAELTEHFRNLMIAKTVRDAKKPIVCSSAHLKKLEEQAKQFELSRIMAILTALQETAGRLASGNRRCEMEMMLIRLCNPSVSSDYDALVQRVAALEQAGRIGAGVRAATPTPKTAPDPTPAEDEAPPLYDDSFAPLPEEDEMPQEQPLSAEAQTIEQPATPSAEQPIPEWDEILKILRTTCPLIAGVLSGSSAYIRDAYLLIDTQSSQFRTLVNGANSQYRDQIRSAAQQVLGKSFKLGPYRSAETKETDPMLSFAQRLQDLNLSK